MYTNNEQVNQPDARIPARPQSISGGRGVGPFTMIPLQTVLDPRMSPRSLGVLAYMISRASIPDWRFYVSDIASHFNVGQRGDAIRRSIQELEDLGYLERHQLRAPDGRVVGLRYVVHALADYDVTALDGETRVRLGRSKREDFAGEPVKRGPGRPKKQPAEEQEGTDEGGKKPRRNKLKIERVQTVIVGQAPAAQPVSAAPATVPAPVAAKTEKGARKVSPPADGVYQRVISAYMTHRGDLPGKRALPDGSYLLSAPVRRLIDSALKDVKGDSDMFVEMIEAATRQAAWEARSKPGEWMSQNGNIDHILRHYDRLSTSAARNRALSRTTQTPAAEKPVNAAFAPMTSF